MFAADKVKLILVEEFASLQAKNPRYSMRAYAKRIGVSQTAISEILSGKRPLSRKTAEKILSGLDRSPEEIINVLNGPIEKEASDFRPLDMDVFQLISDWYYYAILSLTETKNFDSSPLEIAKRLGISEKVAHDAIERLLRLDLITRDPKTKKLKATGEQLAAISPIKNPALKKASRQNLELAQRSLEEDSFEERDHSAITLCFDPDRMEEARLMIRKFRRKFNDEMESGNKKEVYKLCIQLFPLSRRNRK